MARVLPTLTVLLTLTACSGTTLVESADVPAVDVALDSASFDAGAADSGVDAQQVVDLGAVDSGVDIPPSDAEEDAGSPDVLMDSSAFDAGVDAQAVDVGIGDAGCSPACAAGQVCIAGECFAPVDGAVDSGTDVPVDAQRDAVSPSDTGPCTGSILSACCDGGAANLNTDPGNCGACGHACTSGWLCSLGACAPACEFGLTMCGTGSSARCIGLGADPNNCGACGNVCNLPNAMSMSCSAGTCTIGLCDPGYANCDFVETHGCNVNIASDTHNCGECGMVCPTGFSCVGGACQS